MNNLTKNLKYFSGLTLIYSMVFFYLLYTALAYQTQNKIWIYATLYGVALFTTGLILGYNDSVRNSRLDLGFMYHFATFVVVNSIAVLSLLIAMGISIRTVVNCFLSIALWGIGLLVHYYFSARSIKGYGENEIFV